MEQSDFMIYTDIAMQQFKDKRTNDLAYMYQMSQTQPRCLMDRSAEHSLFIDQYKTKIPFCNSCTETRGGNCMKKEDNFCPHPEYTKAYLNEFLIVPCPKANHKNHITCNDSKCCQYRHQLFRNNTKRKISL